MEPNSGRKSPMSNAFDISALSRSAAEALVNGAVKSGSKRMKAYDDVARAVGMSGEWLRKFIKGDEAKEPGLSVGWKLIEGFEEIYDRVCTRVEQQEANNRALRERIDATVAGLNRVAARVEKASGGTTKTGSTNAR